MPPLAVDLGSSTIRIQAGRGRLYEEPALVALDARTHKIIGVGAFARRLVGRSAPHIVQLRPVRDGVVAQHEVTAALMSHYIRKALGWRRWLRYAVTLPVAARATTVERRAIKEAALRAGARNPVLIDAPLAAALGAGLDIDTAAAHLIVHLGAAGADIAVISMGRILAHERCGAGGEALDRAIVRHLERTQDLVIGPTAAERLKIELGTASAETAPPVASRTLMSRVPGSGLPRPATVSAEAVREALQPVLVELSDAVLAVAERVTPELAADLAERGAVLTGGGARLRGMAPWLAQATGLPVRVADDAASCVLRGALRADEWMRKPRILPLERRSPSSWQPV